MGLDLMTGRSRLSYPGTPRESEILIGAWQSAYVSIPVEKPGTFSLMSIPGRQPFTFANFALDPFVAINDSCECNNLLRPASPSSRSLNLGGRFLGTSDTWM